jgi:serine/threonine-protein kinase HipA
VSDGSVDVWVELPRAGLVRVGSLRPSFQGARNLAAASFVYDDEYLDLPDAFAISPDLPLRPGRLLTDDRHEIFGAFSDASPDEWGQKIIDVNHEIRRAREPSLAKRLGAFDYLVGVSDHARAGALRLRDPSTRAWLADDEGVANHYDLDRVVTAARRYEANEATPDDLAYLGDIATSPGGARPKANVVTAADRLGIAKLPHSKDGRIDVERWEALALDLAELCGIRTPPRAVYPTGDDKSVLVLERFDRTAEGGRIPYISGATALGLGRYDDRRVNYREFTDVIVDLCEDSATELREMFTRVALTVLISNVDDHWRNHGFLRVEGRWMLSPVFDINPSRGSSVRSRAISDDDDPFDRDIAHLLEIASAFRLGAREGAAIIDRVARVVETWPDIATELAIPESQQELMRPAFDPAQLARIRQIADSLLVDAEPGPRVGKAAALDRLGALLDRRYELGVGSSVPSAVFDDAARRAGVATGGTMPERAQRVVEAAGLPWDATFDSRNSPSGGGSTVTLAGLERLIDALEIHLGA